MATEGTAGESSVDFRVVIHGGSFVQIIAPEHVALYEESLSRIIRNTYSFVCAHNGDDNFSAVDVCEFAVKLLEDDPLYNAGVGSVFTNEQTHELEASIMDGAHRQMGAASLLHHVKNPVSLARVVMQHSVHNYLAGMGAESLAKKHDLEIVENSHFSTTRRLDQLSAFQQAKKGTVGCVCALNGHVAAATSTGGMTGKKVGRIGDSPLVGCGTYAEDESAAVSCTGTGEEIMRHVTAYDLCARMKYSKLSLSQATHAVLHEYLPADTTGIIAVTRTGDYVMQFNTQGMLRATCGGAGDAAVGIFAEEKSIVL